MNERRLQVKVDVDGFEEYKEKLSEVEAKINELEKSIKELNEIDITINVKN